ncbi:E3 ubiquitin-protein ligase BRE1A-like [Hydractinia symbiolongicarpus]|uniref:E3 ubiquitin-protein ligase BRE1A-like n=1 Tax=Hydractinia symbiolongicarpus TaxID=13093 RepID=UPI00254AC3D9|nr:E3 ubiquitin-protein ligase BRE1A-like [Hydractinia symbiolongicarpus]
MASKRTAPETGSSSRSEPPSKKSFMLSEPVKLGSISTEEELDNKVLKFQNAKLYTRLEEKNAQEEESRARFAKLERLRENDQNIISAMNIAWNQLDEDVTLLLQRFENINDDDQQGMSVSTVEFLEKLSNRTTKGMKEEIHKRVMHSGLITKRLVHVLEKVLIRSQDLTKMFEDRKKKAVKNDTESIQRDKSNEDNDDYASQKLAEGEDREFEIHSIELGIRNENSELKAENKRLHDSLNGLHDKYNAVSTEFSEIKDKLATSQKENAELHAKQEDMEYDLQRATKQFEKLIKKLNETHEQAKVGSSSVVTASIALKDSTPEEVKAEIEDKEELAKNRLIELEKLQESYAKLSEDYEKLRLQTLEISDEAVVNSTKYKMLQTQFNLLYNDAQVIRKNCEDARRIVVNNRNQHLQQIEQMENENIQTKKRMRAEVSQFEKVLTESRKELELLRVEYEHNMKAHEQIGPMAKEMRHLINSLQNHNQQLKGEVQRYKRKLTDAEKKLLELEKTSKSADDEDNATDYIDRIEAPNASPRSDSSQSSNEGADSDDVKVLRTKLKNAREKRKEMKLLLDMYKGVSKETRDKVELLKNEKTLKDEVGKLKGKLIVVTEDVVKQSKRFADQDHMKQCKKLQQKIEELQKTISNTKQEGDALLGEMELTGQAFEEMQEQNIRLMQQLREKDDTNLKLMSERIKSNQIQKLLREEKEVLTDKCNAMNSRHTAIEEVVKRLEEREKVLQTAVNNMEKENSLRQQAIDLHKRKAVELGQQCQEMMFKNETVIKQFDETKKTVLEKTNRLEEEVFKCNRIQEENSSIKKKLDKAKRMEYLGASDEILVEEVKMYKGKLTCPCCNTRPKDAILTKCFHVFCFECLKTRYDTRQRKCPKCNATFGNNDFHKMYM